MSRTSLVEASADLGANPAQAFRTVILPLALPGLIAGSIFTFSLTLGDYIIPQIIGTSRYFIGQAVYAQQGTAGNIPLAAAFTVVPIVIMGIISLGGEAASEPSMRSDASPSAPWLLGIAAVGGPAVSPPASGADHPLCLHHRGEELPVPPARSTRFAGSASPGDEPIFGSALAVAAGGSLCDAPGTGSRHRRCGGIGAHAHFSARR